MTESGRPEIGRQDVPWKLAAHRIDVLRMSVDPKMVQILTKIFKTLLIFIKVLSPYSTENCVCVGYLTQMKLTQTT